MDRLAAAWPDPLYCEDTMTAATPAPKPPGLPRVAAGKQGEAVHLSTVVRWLMDEHQCARVEAVERYLLPPLEEGGTPMLYIAQEGSNAVQAEPVEWFASASGYRSAPARRQSRGNLQSGYRPAPTCPSLGSGTAGAVKWLRLVWGDGRQPDGIMEAADANGPRLVVDKATALRLWSYGSLKAVADTGAALAEPTPFQLKNLDELRAFRQRTPKPKWDEGNQRDLLVELVVELVRSGRAASESAAQSIIAVGLDVSRQTVAEQCRIHRGQQRNAGASVMTAMAGALPRATAKTRPG